jgi:dTDP-4-dehydrorhamnose reductase
MKILLIGANGQLGTDLHRVFAAKGWEVRPVRHAEADVRDATAISALIARSAPDLVVNTAAFIRVDDCEKDPRPAFEVNAVGALNVAKACRQSGAALVHFSTDYAFDGAKRTPYLESDCPTPLNVYGASKVAGEHLVAAVTPRYFLLRVCGLFGLAGSSGKGGNFVEAMLKKAHGGQAIRAVDDQVLAPTYTLDLAQHVAGLITTQAYGLYHITAAGQCSWYEFACKIFALAGLRPQLTACRSEEFAAAAKRPSFSVLSNAKYNALGLGQMPPWEDGLARYLKARAQDGG